MTNTGSIPQRDTSDVDRPHLHHRRRRQDGRVASDQEVMRILRALTYTLGMADGLISTQIVSCPAGYIPPGEVIAKRAAEILSGPDPAQPKATVTVAVLAALTLDGCTAGPRAKEGQGQR